MSAPTGRRLRLEPDARREQILSAAQRLFAERSYDSVSTTELAAAAGTTRTNLHYYFGTKRALYLEVVRRFAHLPAPPAPRAGENRAVAVEATFGRWLDLVEANRETYVTMLGAGTPSRDPEVDAVLHDSIRAWEDWLLSMLDLADRPAHRAAVRAFQSLVTTATDEWLRRGTLTRDEVLDLLCRSLLALAPERDGALLTDCQ